MFHAKAPIYKVWIDWNNGAVEPMTGEDTEIQRYEFHTQEELNAFLEGVTAASTAWAIDDYRQLDTYKEVQEWIKECKK